ncbi:peptidase [Hazenella coriacea]|nr:peptidase [Hazenella coriacea]
MDLEVFAIAVILLFIDGVGLGEEAEYNPWFSYDPPFFKEILNGNYLTHHSVGKYGSEILLLATDSKLGVEGIPQSATGQAAIFTGNNAPKMLGRHMSGLPFRRLRNWVKEDNIYLQLQAKDWSATFANSYTQEYFARPATQRGWVSVTTAALQSSGQPIRYFSELLAGEAVYHDITRQTLKKVLPDVNEITPEQAARDCLGIARQAEVVIHEFFLSDRAGHKRDPQLISWVIETYDRFLGELTKRKATNDTIVLVSDHGNSEDLRVPTHTENPVPTLIIGDTGAIEELGLSHWDLTCIAPLVRCLVQRQHQ